MPNTTGRAGCMPGSSENLVELQLPRNSWFGGFWEPGYERLFDHEFGPTR